MINRRRLVSTGLIFVGAAIVVVAHDQSVRWTGLALVVLGGVLLLRWGPYYD
jgi:hypothetical protein